MIDRELGSSIRYGHRNGSEGRGLIFGRGLGRKEIESPGGRR